MSNMARFLPIFPTRLREICPLPMCQAPLNSPTLALVERLERTSRKQSEKIQRSWKWKALKLRWTSQNETINLLHGGSYGLLQVGRQLLYQRSYVITSPRRKNDDDTRDKPRKFFFPLLYIVEERGPAMHGPVAHWMRRCCLSDPSGLKHKLFWRFDSSLVRLDSTYT